MAKRPSATLIRKIPAPTGILLRWWTIFVRCFLEYGRTTGHAHITCGRPHSATNSCAFFVMVQQARAPPCWWVRRSILLLAVVNLFVDDQRQKCPVVVPGQANSGLCSIGVAAAPSPLRTDYNDGIQFGSSHLSVVNPDEDDRAGAAAPSLTIVYSCYDTTSTRQLCHQTAVSIYSMSAMLSPNRSLVDDRRINVKVMVQTWHMLCACVRACVYVWRRHMACIMNYSVRTRLVKSMSSVVLEVA